MESKVENLASRRMLSNGVGIPCVGFGTWQTPSGDVARDVVKKALEVGFRHIDTATAYGNEASVGEGIRLSGVKREDVFIANVLKCRPPGNRDPRPEEIEVCTPFLREQTRTINPEFIVTLGNFATKFVLKTEVGITRLHGTLQQAGRFKVFPIYHPAAAIYDRTKWAALENDFATLGELLKQ